MHKNSTFLIIIGFIATSSPALSRIQSPALKWRGKDKDIISKYQTTLNNYRKLRCPYSITKKFETLIRNNKKNGFHLPYSNGKIDKKTIAELLPLVKQKLDWLMRLKKNYKTLPSSNKLINPIREEIEVLLGLKERYFLSDSKADKNLAAKRSKEHLQILNQKVATLFKEIPYYLSFQHPIDHYNNRVISENTKGISQRKRNKHYFKRKIIEDGMLGGNQNTTDIYFRSTSDTIALKLNSSNNILPEDLRYDLSWFLDQLDSKLKQNPKTVSLQLAEWIDRTQRAIDYYNKILNGTIKPIKTDTKELRDFVYKRQTKAYAYFAKQPEIIRALYSIDQILLNEVGQATSENHRDRADIIGVIINRRFNQKYSQFTKGETLLSYLKDSPETKTLDLKKHPWLNVLYKESQFSFTLYFMPAVIFSVCPDFYRSAKASRKDNLKLALKVLREPDQDFKALRYFSRLSMLGKIDISPLWKNYKRIAERPGRKLINIKLFKNKLSLKKYLYLYNFVSAYNYTFHVIQMGEETFSVAGFPDNPIFFNHRNRHHFSYFERKN